MVGEVFVHPYNDIAKIPSTTQILIIGTAPPPAENDRDVEFFYGTKANQLWKKIFADIYSEYRLSDGFTLCKIKRLLLSQKIWPHDILQKYSRKKITSNNVSKESALDSHLIKHELSDLLTILRTRPSISTLVFTGTRAEYWSGQQLECQRIIPEGSFWKTMRGKRIPRERFLTIKLGDSSRTLRTFTAPSPSRRSAQFSMDRKISLYRAALAV